MNVTGMISRALVAAGMAAGIAAAYDRMYEHEVLSTPPQTEETLACMEKAVQAMAVVARQGRLPEGRESPGRRYYDEQVAELLNSDEVFYYALSRMCSRLERAAENSAKIVVLPEIGAR
jgi:phage tail tape-measure protein